LYFILINRFNQQVDWINFDICSKNSKYKFSENASLGASLPPLTKQFPHVPP